MTVERDENLVWRPDIDNLFNRGVWLGIIGVRNWGLCAKDALSALEELRKQKVAVLGGDVYTFKEGKPKPSRDNWYFDIRSIYPVNASIEKAQLFITDYHQKSPEALFALVPKVK